MIADALAKEAGIPTELFTAKTKEFRKKHDDLIKAQQMVLSDENDEGDDFSDSERDLFN